MRTLVKSTYKHLGWSWKKRETERMLQTEILSLACRLHVEDCKTQAMERFRSWINDENS